MDDMSYCPHCGKLLQSGYRFCPFCGTAQRGTQDWETLLDQCLAPLEQQERGLLLDRIVNLESKIDRLDREITVFLDGKLAPCIR